ncbi:Condensin-2 complex subunit H2 [Rhynchospora pubera]|uniref:Condensin-2 complex subunit H2 n=1 Tax=Rhynchospora pubera TaxID=906938 RepID=A0AAV8D386_9POAL|nr:Condensin-2 complex subunit H2 [Rhynchospora pubera]
MSDDREELLGGSAGNGGGAAGRTFMVQPGRDLQSNWEVDLAEKLEQYLLKICSGEITSSEEDQVLHSVNFAEAALLLQGSVQVYSRKVEYLYSLVLHALEFLSQKRQQDQPEKGGPDQSDGKRPDPVANQEEEEFLGLDDVPVDPKASLDSSHDKDNTRKATKAPANLIVMEGDCLDTGGADEIESYLLATCEFYNDFLLLDPCDARSVKDFLNATPDKDKESDPVDPGSTIKSKNRQSAYKSPSARKSSQRKCKENEFNMDEGVNLEGAFECEAGENVAFECEAGENVAFECEAGENDANWNNNDYDMGHQDAPDFGVSDGGDDSEGDDDDPWKPLDPYEPGTLRIKPFKKVKAQLRRLNFTTKRCMQFPIAKFDPRLNFQKKSHASSESPPLMEKLMRSLTVGDEQNNEFFSRFANNPPDYVEDMGEDMGENDPHDFDAADAYMGFDNMENDVPSYPEDNGNNDMNAAESVAEENLDSHENLEDLCRSHLDALLASVADTERQSEIAARVSTWKEKIEDAMEEQDAHPPFDIGLYGDHIIDKLSSEAAGTGVMTFTEVVSDKPKYEVARTFSALLQLVNSRKVDLERPEPGKDLVCHTASNPFKVRFLGQGTQLHQVPNPVQNPGITLKTRKRVKSPLKKASNKGHTSSPMEETGSPTKSNGKVTVKLSKSNIGRCTPDSKRRRHSISKPVNLEPDG